MLSLASGTFCAACQAFFVFCGISAACRAPKGVNGKMKIKYEFANETVEIEVYEEWGNILVDLNRQEYNINHKETRRHYSLDACQFEGADFAVEDDAFDTLFAEPTAAERLHTAIAKLKPEQQKLIRAIYFEGVSVNDYARMEGCTQSAISHRLQTIRNKLKKLF